AVLEGGYAIRGALPYTNLAICLALAGLPFDDIREPDWKPDSARQSPRINDILKKSCDDALALFRNPPARPTEGREERGFWVRHKDIFYDTDMLHEKQKEAFRLCPHCPGFGLFESASSRTPLSLCAHVPRAACRTCREQAREYADAGGKAGKYYAVLLNDHTG
ncbi:MAG: histone deacetylase, partial [Deltaproteobacteria bacterium]|nr:histone deacetylase [Deltaproteobacteria bacterium]